MELPGGLDLAVAGLLLLGSEELPALEFFLDLGGGTDVEASIALRWGTPTEGCVKSRPQVQSSLARKH